MRKKKFDASKWIKERNAEINKVAETKPTEDMGPGSHKMYALQMRKGFIKPKTIKRLEKITHLKKRKKIEGV